MKGLIISYFILNLVFAPVLISAHSDSTAPAHLEPTPLTSPETLEESSKVGKNALIALPGALKKGFIETFEALRYIWRSYIWPRLKAIWPGIEAPFQKEIERRESAIRKGTEEEKTFKALTEKKSFWERLKDLIKK